jgi:hypothetical protein
MWWIFAREIARSRETITERPANPASARFRRIVLAEIRRFGSRAPYADLKTTPWRRLGSARAPCRPELPPIRHRHGSGSAPSQTSRLRDDVPN